MRRTVFGIWMWWFAAIGVHGTGGGERSYASCFGTRKFMFVGLSDCHLTSELSTRPGKCTYHSLHHAGVRSTSPPCSNLKLHLWLDDGSPPKALIIGGHGSFLVAQVRPIVWPDSDGSGTEFRETPVNIETSHVIIYDIFNVDNVLWTLFNTRSRILFVEVNHTNPAVRTVQCHLFLAYTTAAGRLKFENMGFLDVHALNDQRIMWTEDPYRNKFYYSEVNALDQDMTLYSVPFNEIVPVLVEGRSGFRERTLRGTRRYFSVSRGVAISYANSHNKLVQYIHNVESTSEIIVCENELATPRTNASLNLLIVFGEDFCALKESAVEARDCRLEEKADRVPPPPAKEESSDGFFYWMLALIIILIVVVVILVAFIVCHRKPLDTTFVNAERPQMRYYPTFISDPSFDF